MKKVSRILLVILCLALLLSFASCAGGFMSRTKVNSLVKKYGTPQAEITFDYNYDSNKMKLVFVYNLLLDKTPIAVINFINLVESGYFDDVIIQRYNSTYQYLQFGDYVYRADESDNNTYKYYENREVSPIVGEFAVNKYREPKSGYAEFENLALAMYHDEGTKYYDTASGNIMMALRTKPVEHTNYAVFAHLDSLTVSYNDKEPSKPRKVLPSDVWEQLAKTNTSTRTVYTADGTESNKLTLYATNIKVSIKMLGDKDWSKLPKVTK